ncbi:MAG: hypothetical protein IPP37_03040 [Saprospiraceae bacterium]|nr:hypothetical protein [Saprospiraceae bacterium]
MKEIATLPAGLNDEANARANNILQYASQRTAASVDIDYDVKINRPGSPILKCYLYSIVQQL